MEEAQILLADDHSMICKGLKVILTQLGYRNVSEVQSCKELMRELTKRRYTHLVLDINLKDGNSLNLLPEIRSGFPDLRISMFSMTAPEKYGKTLQKFGVFQCLSKDLSEEDTVRAMQRFLQNEYSYRDIARSQYPEESPFSCLSPRELEILRLVLHGLGTKEIGEKLNVKMNTISTVKNRIFDKTLTSNLKELIELASFFHVNY
jgi:two-component system, NarL family, invasion response regulator UvrY